MIKIHHLNCVDIESPSNGPAVGHCLLLEAEDRLVLVDAGVGLADTRDPNKRLGRELIALVGFRLDEHRTAFRQIQKLGLDPAVVTDCVISHLDPDHIGGLADFPKATVHVSLEEYENFYSGNPRYLVHQLDHRPPIRTYASSSGRWYGLEARKLNIPLDIEIYLIPLFGHTHGHCGVAIGHDEEWTLYIADAYYLREELSDPEHPVSKLAEMRADDNRLREDSLDIVRIFSQKHPDISIFSYHDPKEFEVFEPNEMN